MLINQFIDTSGGSSPGPALPGGFSAPVANLNTLANAMASCINSMGGVAKDGTACGKFLDDATPPGGNRAHQYSRRHSGHRQQSDQQSRPHLHVGSHRRPLPAVVELRARGLVTENPAEHHAHNAQHAGGGRQHHDRHHHPRAGCAQRRPVRFPFKWTPHRTSPSSLRSTSPPAPPALRSATRASLQAMPR